MKPKQNITAVEQHPLAGSSFISLMKLFLGNGGVDKEYLPQALSVATASFLTIPLKIFEDIKFSQKIAETQLEFPPIFIIGHPRSGTTYFQYLMSLDPNLGYLENWQAMRGSEIFLSNQELAKRWADSNYPRKRISDGVMMFANSPAEEEYPLANACPYSFYSWFYFPKNMRKIFQNFVLFEGVDQQIISEWKRAYTKMLKRITLSANGKRLILKNPINTARVKILLSMFPDAKFIHIYRNPYSIYASTNTLYKKIVRLLGLQTINEAELEENIIFIYKQMMERFLVDKSSIPPENLIEIKYEDFIGNEIQYFKQIYDQFNLPEFEQAEAEFKKYVKSQANYETNKYTLDEETIKKITEEWRFTIEKWQYDLPTEMKTKAAS